VTTVCGELKRHFRDKIWATHVTRRQRDLSVDMRRATVRLMNSLQREPTTAELAEYLDLSEAQIRYARLCSAGYATVLLSSHNGNDGSLELGDTLGDLDPDLEILADKLTVMELMHLLPQRIQRMLALRFYGNKTQAQIAAEFNVSQMQVSRLLGQALTWLRTAMLSDASPRWMADEHALYSDGMRVRVGRSEGVVTVRISGEIDHRAADQLRLSLHSAVMAAAGSHLVIDVTGMPIADAAAGVLRDACRAAALTHVEVTLTGVRPTRPSRWSPASARRVPAASPAAEPGAAAEYEFGSPGGGQIGVTVK
jgi:RNA polymerase sigma-B factor